jgi:hypothetical protein
MPSPLQLLAITSLLFLWVQLVTLHTQVRSCLPIPGWFHSPASSRFTPVVINKRILLYKDWIVSHCVHIPHFLHLFICGGTQANSVSWVLWLMLQGRWEWFSLGVCFNSLLFFFGSNGVRSHGFALARQVLHGAMPPSPLLSGWR